MWYSSKYGWLFIYFYLIFHEPFKSEGWIEILNSKFSTSLVNFLLLFLWLLLLLSQFCYHLLEFIFDYYFLDPFSMSSILIFNSFYLLYFPSEFCSIFLSWFNFWHISPAVHWHCCINLAIMLFLFKKVFFRLFFHL